MAEFTQDLESATDHEVVMEEDLLRDGEAVLLEDRTRQIRERGLEERLPRRAQVRAGDLLAGKYLVERVHPRGLSGFTVDAEHLQLGQRVAIKLSHADTRASPESTARFLRGARLAAQLRSKNVARVIDLGTLDSGTPYSVTEHLSGTDLRGVLRVRECLPITEGVDYTLQVCEALAEAHVLGLAHRNLKLSNLFLARENDGSVGIKVLDFCLAEGPFGDLAAAASMTGLAAIVALGSLAPEQIRDPSSVDLRADIWALGAVLHELLTGAPVHAASSALGLLAAIAADPPTPACHLRPEVPAELEAVILRCLEKDRDCRWPDLGTLAKQLSPFASAQGRDTVDRTIMVLERRMRGGRSSMPPPLPGSTRAITHIPALKSVREPAPRSRTLELGVAALGIVGCSIGIGAFVSVHNLQTLLATRPTERPVIASLSPALAAPQATGFGVAAGSASAQPRGQSSAPTSGALPALGTIRPPVAAKQLRRPTPQVEATPGTPSLDDMPTEQAAAMQPKVPAAVAQHALFDSAN